MQQLIFNGMAILCKLAVKVCFSLCIAVYVVALSKIELGMEEDLTSALEATIDDAWSLKENNLVLFALPEITI